VTGTRRIWRAVAVLQHTERPLDNADGNRQDVAYDLNDLKGLNRSNMLLEDQQHGSALPIQAAGRSVVQLRQR